MTERTQGPPVQFRAARVERQIGARLDAGGSPGLVAARDLERYYAVLDAELARVALSEPEAMAVVDALNGAALDAGSYRLFWASVSDALAEGLAGKWDIDGSALVAILRALSPAQAMAVIDAVERWWVIADAADDAGGEDPAERGMRLRAVGLVR